MSEVPSYLYGGDPQLGGIVSYPLERLRQEVAALAMYFHWPYETIMTMEHEERRLWVKEMNKLLRKN